MSDHPICERHNERRDAVPIHPRIAALIFDLPISQAGTHRHRCAVCAFEAGRAEGRREGIRQSLAVVVKALEGGIREITSALTKLLESDDHT